MKIEYPYLREIVGELSRRGCVERSRETRRQDEQETPPRIRQTLIDTPIIAAVNEPPAFEVALQSPPRAVYLLTGNPLSLPGMLHRAAEQGKQCLVNIDFLDGLARDKFAVEFLASQAKQYNTDSNERTWTDFCQMLFAGNAFLYVD